MRYVRALKSVSYQSRAEIGGKAGALGEMKKCGFPIPACFVITAQARSDWIQGTLPALFLEEVVTAYRSLGAQRVAVRSSGVVEDGDSASWAGQFDSFLDIREVGLLDAIERCWASSDSARADTYAEVQSTVTDHREIAVVVQRMVESDVSGVMFTANPISGALDECVIEAVFGLAELHVQGRTTPDTFVVDKANGAIRSHRPHRQELALISSPSGTREMTLGHDRLGKPTLDDADLQELTRLGAQIEKCFGMPQDVEWASEDGEFQIVQSRPITSLAQRRTSRG